jgi:transcriptional regulator with XRE-family HTH domain
MRKKEHEKKIAPKLKQIRQANNYSITGMANRLRVHRISYARNEDSQSIPGFSTLYKLGNEFNISLDWLILDKGSMHCTGKVEGEGNKTAQDTVWHRSFPDDINELLDHMGKIPLLRFEILSQFYRFKKENQELVEKEMNSTPEA